MKRSFLTTLCVVLATTFSHAQAAKPAAEPAAKPAAKPAAESTAIDPTATVTMTIEVNGKRETRTFSVGEVVHVEGQIEPATTSWLGIAADALSDELAAQLPLEKGIGLLVREVMTDSPAAKAGLLVNDVLVKFDNLINANKEQFREILRAKKIGDLMEIAYLRRGKEQKVTATLGARPAGTATMNFNALSSIEISSAGLSVEELLKAAKANDAAGNEQMRMQIRVLGLDSRIFDSQTGTDGKILELDAAAKERIDPAQAKEILEAIKSQKEAARKLKH